MNDDSVHAVVSRLNHVENVIIGIKSKNSKLEARLDFILWCVKAILWTMGGTGIGLIFAVILILWRG